MRKYAWTVIVAGALATTGCNQAELKKALADAKAAEAQKDSLLTEVLETTQFVTDINSELAKAKSLAVTTHQQRSRRFRARARTVKTARPRSSGSTRSSPS